jgi:hypothetical protein
VVRVAHAARGNVRGGYGSGLGAAPLVVLEGFLEVFVFRVLELLLLLHG